jgi:hypothetical protein
MVKLKDEADVAVAELDELAVVETAKIGVGDVNLTSIGTIETAST